VRGPHIGLLDDLSHCIRWHEQLGAVIALMTDPLTGKATGVQRIFLNRDGTKRERKMLGRQGVIRLSPDDEVTLGLGICEGIEDGLDILLMGWRPVWTATSCTAIANFPVLQGIECLTIFHDNDAPGTKAAHECAAAVRRRRTHLPKQSRLIVASPGRTRDSASPTMR
jgi:putative DNA primase/helicase